MPIEYAAGFHQRQVVQLLLPHTSRITLIRYWTVQGVMDYYAPLSRRTFFESKVEPLRSKAHEFMLEGRYDDAAIDRLTTALSFFPARPGVLFFERYDCWLHLGNGSCALHDAHMVLRFMDAGQSSECHRRVGAAYMLLGQYSEAVASLERALQLNPGAMPI
ncbi:hypothetical protein CCACVL1_14418 [Corchorus capsularis]|uniref:Uncharacterized protein n=1 Tax=Corchorus capsularis TaxID=210143 RepID=A0A1R3I718_COCAP|nr:hypothetical protein CCACVL1_14418 [Corchorus capsularis]